MIPSLFPYFIFSNILISTIQGRWAIPVIGFLGGYPAGAQAISNAYRSNRLNKEDALDLLCYCNNAGPAFIFGMLSPFFSTRYVPWLIWWIHITSALFVRMVMVKRTKQTEISASKQPNIASILSASIKGIAIVCTWVFLFRILLQILRKRFFFRCTPILTLILSGILELTNGCCSLNFIGSQQLRFILATGFLSFGGICVTMQTASVAKELSIKKYVFSKILQTIFSLLLAIPLSFVIF